MTQAIQSKVVSGTTLSVSGDELVQTNLALEKQSALQRVAWALENLPHNFMLSSSFGAQAAVMLHMVTQQYPDMPVVLTDTGYLFAETYQFVDELTERLNLNLKVYRADASSAWQEARMGKMWEQGLEGIEKYNALNKVEPMQKALDAYDRCNKVVIVEDDGLFIDSLSGFPGPFSSYVFKTIGNNGILKIIGNNRDAQFRAIIAFCDSKKEPILFESKVVGKISENVQGTGWGFDPIFIPEKQNKTYAQLAEKNKISHRYESLKKFANWFRNKQE